MKSCETSYTHDALDKADIQVHELIFQDGQLPSQEVINSWLKIVDDFFDPPQNSPPQPATPSLEAKSDQEEVKKVEDAEKKIAQSAAASSMSGIQKSRTTRSQSQALKPEKRIAVHCVAGLGRAPFLVALALVYKGCKPSNAINLIRNNRKGALNPI